MNTYNIQWTYAKTKVIQLMSIESFDDRSPITPDDDLFRALSQELAFERPSHALADDLPGTRFLLDTDSGFLEFKILPWGKEEAMEPDTAIYAEVVSGKELVGGSRRITILGRSELGVMESSDLGKIRQYSDLQIRPIKDTAMTRADMPETERELNRLIETGQILYTEMGIFRVEQGEPQPLKFIKSLIRQPRDDQDTPTFLF